MAEKFSNVPKVTHVGGREANLDSLIPEPPFYLLLTTITDKPLQTSFSPSSNLPPYHQARSTEMPVCNIYSS